MELRLLPELFSLIPVECRRSGLIPARLGPMRSRSPRLQSAPALCPPSE